MRRSAWVRGPRTAGPLRRLRTRNWMPPRSAVRPIRPSKASISRTRWPLPRPPTAGLHDIAPMVAKRWVTSAALAPIRAAAAAASQPAWPPPTTITSYCVSIPYEPSSAELLSNSVTIVYLAPPRVVPQRHVSRETWRQDIGRARAWLKVSLAAPLFPDTEISEDHIQDVLHVDSAQKLAQCPGRQAKVFRHDFLAALLGCASRTLERKSGFSQMRALALPRDQRRLRCEEARCKY